MDPVELSFIKLKWTQFIFPLHSESTSCAAGIEHPPDKHAHLAARTAGTVCGVR